MSILEICIVFSELILLVLLWYKTPDKPRVIKSLFFVPLILLVAHAIFEGTRWQMGLSYGMAGILPVSVFIPWHISKFFKIFLSFIAILLIATSGMLSYLLPVFHLPKPTGKFKVGITYLHFQGKRRPELITKDTTDFRELMVRAWYPAEAGVQTTFPYMPPELSGILAATKGLPGFMLSHFNLIKTNAAENAVVAGENASFPLIIFSHGHMSHSSMYTSILETLASHGYIILSIDYTYETPLTIFPDGDLTYFDPTYTDVWKNASWDSVQASLEGFRKTQDLAMKRRQIKKYLAHVPYTSRIDLWAKDIKFVIDELQHNAQLPDEPLFSKINPNKIGVMGHSVGGAASALACALDGRVKAGINLDGSQWGSLMDTVISQPFLWVTAEKDPVVSGMDADAFIYKTTVENDFYHLEVAHATHANFYDLSLWANHPAITQTGTIDGHKMIAMINDCTQAFFDHYLKQKPLRLHNLPEKFKELTLVTD